MLVRSNAKRHFPINTAHGRVKREKEKFTHDFFFITQKGIQKDVKAANLTEIEAKKVTLVVISKPFKVSRKVK